MKLGQLLAAPRGDNGGAFSGQHALQDPALFAFAVTDALRQFSNSATISTGRPLRWKTRPRDDRLKARADIDLFRLERDKARHGKARGADAGILR